MGFGGLKLAAGVVVGRRGGGRGRGGRGVMRLMVTTTGLLTHKNHLFVGNKLRLWNILTRESFLANNNCHVLIKHSDEQLLSRSFDQAF